MYTGTSQCICVKERQDLNCDGVEMLWIEVLIPNYKLLVCVLFIDHQELQHHFGIILITPLNKDYILLKKLLLLVILMLIYLLKHRVNEILTLSDLTNVINEPTRMGALLDPVIVSNIDIVVDSEIIEVDRSISDHNAILINIKI